MKKKSRILLKITVFWIMVWGIVLFALCLKQKESFDFFIIDIKSRFVDNMSFLQYCKNKLLLPIVGWFVSCVAACCTEELEWESDILGKNFAINTSDGTGKRIFKAFWLGMVVGFCAAGILFICANAPKKTSKWEGATLFAHACGGIDNTKYTNSREALELSYEKGARVFEIDFQMTSDQKIVCWHGWNTPVNDKIEKNTVMAFDDFMQEKIHDKYTPLSLADVMLYMKEHKEIYVVTDTKSGDLERAAIMFSVFVNTAKENDAMDVLDRFVVQLYNNEMYEVVEQIYPFSHYLLTLSLEGSSGEKFVEHCRFLHQNGIPSITLHYGLIEEENIEVAKRYGIDVYAYTVNSVETLRECQELGVKGFYSDFIFLEDLEQ